MHGRGQGKGGLTLVLTTSPGMLMACNYSNVTEYTLFGTIIYESFIVKWYQTARKGNNKSKQELIIEALD